MLAGAYSVHFLGENFQVRLLVFLVTRIIISGIAKKDSYLWLAVFLRVFQSPFFVLCDGRMLIVRRAVDFAANGISTKQSIVFLEVVPSILLRFLQTGFLYDMWRAMLIRNAVRKSSCGLRGFCRFRLGVLVHN